MTVIHCEVSLYYGTPVNGCFSFFSRPEVSRCEACISIKKETAIQVSSREFCEILKNTFFIENLKWLLLNFPLITFCYAYSLFFENKIWDYNFRFWCGMFFLKSNHNWHHFIQKLFGFNIDLQFYKDFHNISLAIKKQFEFFWRLKTLK